MQAADNEWASESRSWLLLAPGANRADPAGGEGARLPLSASELRRFLVELGVAVYKIPKDLHVVPALPRNPVGKVLKGELRRSFEGEGVATPA